MGRVKDWILNGLTALVAICALIVGAGKIREMLKPDPSRPHRIKDAAQYATAGHVMGPSGASVKIVEFADYQCPFCREMQPRLDTLRQHHHDVSIIYRHFPLFIHDSAVAAARVAECASNLGEFEPMHRELFTDAAQIGKQPWAWFAERAGIADTAQLRRCIATDSTDPAISRDRAAGDKLGIEATPTFLINDVMVARSLTLPELEALVRKAEDKAR